jgi:TolB-like protein/class 3 adenylate cyclase/Flp pilus assembly protein TadD
MGETRKIAAILVADIVGYSRLAGTDEDRTLSRLRGLRSDLIDPAIDAHHGRIVKRTGDGALVEFRSVVDAVRCAIELQTGLIERNSGLPPERRIEFRVGIHLGDVVEEADGDLMGDGVNIAARLEGVAAPGSICLSEDAYRQVKGRLDLSVSDLGPTQLKNIAEPIRVYSLEVDQPVQARPLPVPEKSAPPRLSMVVLPFANIGGDPEQEHFADGVTESLTTDLSRLRGSFVIGRNTAFTYKGKHVDLKQVGRELNVRYVLEGSVQRGGNRMRVNVQLIDAANGSHLWAERFEKPVTDLFNMQDEIVARIANTLNSQLVAVEARRAGRAPTPDSMDLYFQGLAWVNKGVTLENMTKARGFFERALALDPINVDARVGMATVDVNVGVAFVTDDRVARLAAAEAAATEAVSLAPEHAIAHLNLGLVLGVTNRSFQAIAECERALTLDQNLAAAQAIIGQNKLFVGHGEETERHVQEALRLSPRDPWVYTWLMIAGVALTALDRPEEAISWLGRSVESNRNYPLSRFILAAVLANLGQVKEARSEVKTALALDPRFTIASFRATAWSDNPVFLVQRENITDGMRKAGLPEQ